VGHYGGIYQASSAVYRGRAQPQNIWLTHDGKCLSRRTLDKLRRGERGATGAYRLLTELGAPKIRPGEPERAYVERALAEGPFRRSRPRGNHVSAIALGSNPPKPAPPHRLGASLASPKHPALPLSAPTAPEPTTPGFG